MKKVLVLIFLAYAGSASFAQPTAGVTGLLNSPSADMPADGTFTAGANYLPDIVTPQKRFNYDTFNYYAGMAFLPFMELSFRMIMLKSQTEELLNNQDRSISLRVRILKERKFIPAVVMGGNDIFSTWAKGGSQYFKSLYIAGTKTFTSNGNLTSVTAGYAPAAFSSSSFSGVFGGITFSPSFLRSLTIIADYDTQYVNTGASILLLRHLYMYCFVSDFRKVAGGIAIKLYAWGNSASIN